MEKLLHSKKGDLPDMLIFLITIFILAVGFLILAFITPKITDGLNIAGLNNSAEAQGSIEHLENFGTVTIQRGFLFLFVGLSIALMTTSFFVSRHPMFLFLYILFLGLTIFIGTFLGNAYEQIATSPVLADTLASQGLITAIMQNIVMITLIIGALSMIITFAKFSSRFAGGSQGGQL
ncbi:MAG: hypothetical protein ACTSQ4_02435 [Candidatus Heimdallarchaeaceae archaeon]